MGEDEKGDATASQHHPLAVSQRLLMIYSCGVVLGGGLRGGGGGSGTPTVSPSHLASCALHYFNLEHTSSSLLFSRAAPTSAANKSPVSSLSLPYSSVEKKNTSIHQRCRRDGAERDRERHQDGTAWRSGPRLEARPAEQNQPPGSAWKFKSASTEVEQQHLSTKSVLKKRNFNILLNSSNILNHC